MWGSIPGPRDHDLSRRQTRHQQSHPGAPTVLFLNFYFCSFGASAKRHGCYELNNSIWENLSPNKAKLPHCHTQSRVRRITRAASHGRGKLARGEGRGGSASEGQRTRRQLHSLPKKEGTGLPWGPGSGSPHTAATGPLSISQSQGPEVLDRGGSRSGFWGGAPPGFRMSSGALSCSRWQGRAGASSLDPNHCLEARLHA